MLFKVLLVLLLLFLFYQDLRYRAVYWFLFPVLLILIMLIAKQQISLQQILINSLYSLAFILIQLFLLSLYFSFKHKKIIDITTHHLGWGDILFLLVVAFYFSPLNYIAFYVASLATVLLLSLVLMVKERTATLKIPLAGLQALFFLFIALADWTTNFLNFQDDTLIINLMDTWMY